MWVIVLPCTHQAFSSSLLHAIIASNHLPVFKIFSNFVHFCPIFQTFCPSLAFFGKTACMPLHSGIGPDNILWLLIRIRKGTQLLKFLPVILLYYGVDNASGRYTPKDLTGTINACLHSKALDPRRKTEYNCAQMIGKSDVRFRIWFSTWNVGSMLGKWGEISETWKRCCVDTCCFQEVRWKGQGTKMIGNSFKFLWSGSCRAENGVGVTVGNWLIGKVLGIERFNDRVMKVNIVIGDVL